MTIGEFQGLWLRDLGHCGLGAEPKTLQLPSLVLLQPLTAGQSNDRSVFGEDADHVGAAFDLCASNRTSRCDVQPFLSRVNLFEGRFASIICYPF